MEKGTPHYRLATIRALVESGQVRATATAYTGARACGIHDLSGMCAVVLALVPTNFYKSMTTYANHQVWQDVYHTMVAGADDGIYLKLTVLDGLVIVSFKEL